MLYRLHYLLIIITGIILFISSCDSSLQGNLQENLPPKTFFTVDEINLPEGERLVSQVSVSWWGDDPDGYVVGYEILIGETGTAEWFFTERTDSTFILPIQEGNQNADVRFSVRAVDNDGDVDPDPPFLIFPITNSPPKVEFRRGETPPDSTFSVFSFGFEASDPDGEANLNRLEFALNDTLQWFELDINVNLITIMGDNTAGAGQVFSGRAMNPLDGLPELININAENTFYLRAVDNAGAVSPVIQHEWYVKEQTSRILFLNDFPGTTGKTRMRQHVSLLNEIGITQIDFLDISDGIAQGGNRVRFSNALPARSLAAPTINLMLAQWDHIYWLSNDLDRNIGYAIEITLDFFENGGTMFINMNTKNISSDNPVFDFLPIQSMEPLPSGMSRFEIRNNSEITPNSNISNPPHLSVNRNVTGVFPVIPFGETVSLFEADFKTRRAVTNELLDFEGSNLIAAVNPENSVLFFGMDFSLFNYLYDPNAVPDENVTYSDLDRLLEILCIEILGFQQ